MQTTDDTRRLDHSVYDLRGPGFKGAVALMRALVVPPERGRRFLSAAIREADAIADYARRKRILLGGAATWAKAANGAVKEIEAFYGQQLIAPHADKLISVQGTNFPKWKSSTGFASLKEVQDEIVTIDGFLDRYGGWLAEDGASNRVEKQELAKRLDDALIELTGLCGEDVVLLRQREEDTRLIARESSKADMDSLRAASKERGLGWWVIKMIVGNAVVRRRRAVIGALRRITPVCKPFPVVSAEKAAAAANREAAANRQAAAREFLHADSPENAAQSAAVAEAVLESSQRLQNRNNEGKS